MRLTDGALRADDGDVLKSMPGCVPNEPVSSGGGGATRGFDAAWRGDVIPVRAAAGAGLTRASPPTCDGARGDVIPVRAAAGAGLTRASPPTCDGARRASLASSVVERLRQGTAALIGA
jgi:hypothetical protein